MLRDAKHVLTGHATSYNKLHVGHFYHATTSGVPEELTYMLRDAKHVSTGHATSYNKKQQTCTLLQKHPTFRWTPSALTHDQRAAQQQNRLRKAVRASTLEVLFGRTCRQYAYALQARPNPPSSNS